MADNKKYYYLKLKENFYDTEEMIILQNMPDGYVYSDILMKLYLRSLKNNGKLMFKDVIPYTPSALAQVVRHQVGTVEKALKIFQELGLVEILDNGAIYMLDIQNFIGESSTEADRIRNYRARIKHDVQMLEQSNDKSTPEIEKEIKIEKEDNNIYGQNKKILTDNNITLQEDKNIERQKEQELIEHFNLTWKIYPNKKGRAKAEEYFLQWIKGRKINKAIVKLTDKQMYLAVLKYAKECEENGTEQQYIKHGDTFFNKAVLDYVEEKR